MKLQKKSGEDRNVSKPNTHCIETVHFYLILFFQFIEKQSVRFWHVIV